MLTLTFELLVAQCLDTSALHPLGRLTASPRRLDGVAVEVLGQPAEVAVADEGVAAKMAAETDGT